MAEKAKGEAARLEAAKEKLRALEKERDACQQRETALREKLSALEAQAQELERRAQEAQAACAGLDHSALEEAILAKGRAYDAKEKAAAQLLQEAQEEDAQRERALEKEIRSLSGLTGGSALKMWNYYKKGNSISTKYQSPALHPHTAILPTRQR